MEEITNGKILRSWKEIAAHLGVAARSVQRWEKCGSLPVYRQGSGKKARVFAYAAELDKWLETGGARRMEEEARQGAFGGRIRLLLAGIVLFAITGITLWWTDALPQPRTPQGYVLEGSTLTILDAEGRLCWRKAFPAFNIHFAADVRDKVSIADIDNDGRQEVLFNFFPEDLSQRPSSLMCFDQTGRLRWEFRYGRPQTFGGRAFEPDYAGHLIRHVQIAGKPYVLAVANHYRWYPAQVTLLDAKTGRLVEEYWHPGAIYHCVLADIDRDGVQEAIFAAINNPGTGLGHAALGVLKLPFSKAPRRFPPPGDPFPTLTGGGELAYFLFPLPDMCRVMGLLPIPIDLNLQHDRIVFETPLPEQGGIVYSLDFNLRLQEHRFSDNFAPLHNRLYHQGMLDHSLGAEESAELGKLAPFTGAPDGNGIELQKLWKY